MSNVNDYKYAKILDLFKLRILDAQIKKVADAQKIMDDPKYPWKDNDQKKVGQAKLVILKQWLDFYQEFYDEGMLLVKQHENLTNKICKIYESWYHNISNEGRQEIELMSYQADILQSLFVELWEELKPLELDLPIPKASNMK